MTMETDNEGEWIPIGLWNRNERGQWKAQKINSTVGSTNWANDGSKRRAYYESDNTTHMHVLQWKVVEKCLVIIEIVWRRYAWLGNAPSSFHRYFYVRGFYVHVNMQLWFPHLSWVAWLRRWLMSG